MKHKQKTEAIKKTNFAITLLSPLVSYTYTHNHLKIIKKTMSSSDLLNESYPYMMVLAG